MKTQPGQEQAVETELRKLVEYVRNEEPGTLTYLCHRAADEPGQFLFYERYQNQEALNRHMSSARFLQIFQCVTHLLDGPPAIERYEEIAGKR
jgi:quinol monooxygenase YgiN